MSKDHNWNYCYSMVRRSMWWGDTHNFNPSSSLLSAYPNREKLISVTYFPSISWLELRGKYAYTIQTALRNNPRFDSITIKVY